MLNRERTKMTTQIQQTQQYWRQIPDYPKYWINEYGDVYPLRKKDQPLKYREENPQKDHFVRQGKTREGYPFVFLSNGGMPKPLETHLLMEAVDFVTLTKEQFEVDHIDGDKTNNHFTNLRAASRIQRTEEYWRQIPDYPKYWINEYGEVYSSKCKGRLLKSGKNNAGYPCISLSYNDRKTF